MSHHMLTQHVLDSKCVILAEASDAMLVVRGLYQVVLLECSSKYGEQEAALAPCVAAAAHLLEQVVHMLWSR